MTHLVTYFILYPIDIEIPRKISEGKIYKMFFDPTGRHLIITTETGDNYYLFAKWKKAKLLSKIKVKGDLNVYSRLDNQITYRAGNHLGPRLTGSPSFYLNIFIIGGCD